MNRPRLGLFTRLLEEASPADRYRFAIEQITRADELGFASAWVAQHHFGEHEGGLPSPFVLLAAAAQRTSDIALATGVLTLPIDDPLRAAEDASVLDALSGGRVQLGIAAGGTPSSFPAFGRDPARRREIFADHLGVLREALAGRGVRGTESRIYPPAGDLGGRIWQATFSADGGRRAGEAGDGLMLSRTQVRPEDALDQPLHEIQLPIIEAYRSALPDGATPRVLASRTALVVDPEDRDRALALAEPGLRALAAGQNGFDAAGASIEELVAVTDTHVGTVEEVCETLAADETLPAATDVSFQVHSIAAPHEMTLRSLELLATEVAPRLGLATGPEAAASLRAGT
ncbi:putative FMN-dependent luciferase-like monooxygenase [Brachybacterium halotolerans subsp. kimchii]|uniref:putative FMN-dependent luciferase-like monooxygenase n=1 Tax=Brachybacterium halotolerans TaxID=2795215 RepID=UPI001E4FE6A9|nr:putative FMN-dependent luciferase-like monooxygenase [Brachybacterium halotolerans]UEJ81879.1 putative FMN-dependent luciferase-like monooxygenase [Brachybacterium halotolerans subsp. kimchii]